MSGPAITRSNICTLHENNHDLMNSSLCVLYRCTENDEIAREHKTSVTMLHRVTQLTPLQDSLLFKYSVLQFPRIYTLTFTRSSSEITYPHALQAKCCCMLVHVRVWTVGTTSTRGYIIVLVKHLFRIQRKSPHSLHILFSPTSSRIISNRCIDKYMRNFIIYVFLKM
jgi:hypothetical protein